MSILFWTYLGLIVYTYLVYPFLVILVSRFFPDKDPEDSDELPRVTMVISAYNEEEVLEEKIANCRGLTYPDDKIRCLIGSDGSSDQTNQILERIDFPQFQDRIYSEREGKSAVLNKLVREVKDEMRRNFSMGKHKLYEFALERDVAKLYLISRLQDPSLAKFMVPISPAELIEMVRTEPEVVILHHGNNALPVLP